MGKDQTTYSLTPEAIAAIARVEAARAEAMLHGVNVSPVSYTPTTEPKLKQS